MVPVIAMMMEGGPGMGTMKIHSDSILMKKNQMYENQFKKEKEKTDMRRRSTAHINECCLFKVELQNGRENSAFWRRYTFRYLDQSSFRMKMQLES